MIIKDSSIQNKGKIDNKSLGEEETLNKRACLHCAAILCVTMSDVLMMQTLIYFRCQLNVNRLYWITTTRTTLALTTLQQSFFFTDPVTVQYLASTSSILQHTLHSTVNGIHIFVNLQIF